VDFAAEYDGGDVDRLAEVVERRIRHEILYELQTGGGLAFAGEADRAAIRSAVERLKSPFRTAPARVARSLFKPGARVLDVGAGSAPWTLALASVSPTVRVTAIDLPEQTPALRDAVAAAGKTRQYDIVTLDFLADDLTGLGSYDVIVIANVCHLFPETKNRDLLGRAGRLLRREGVLTIVDQVLELDPDWQRWSVLYALGVLHDAPGGYLFPSSTYAGWLREIGLSDVGGQAVCPVPPLTLITGRSRRPSLRDSATPSARPE
jgi:2-polyprenyl-3-methyl-5-hydroxy-6-metoxy-1,4-benzoquinol methylase